MRVASRIIGGLLVLCGLGFFAGLVWLIASGSIRETVAWFVAAFFLAGGLGLLLAGRYYLRLDIDTLDDDEQLPQPVWRYAPYFVAHRRELKVLAQIGLVVSLIHLCAVCFGSEWPGRWLYLPLFIGLVGSFLVPGKPMTLDWNKVPRWIGLLVKSAGTAWLVGWLLLVVWRYWSNRRLENLSDVLAWRVLGAGLIGFIYAYVVVFLSYGELRPPPEGNGTGTP